ncbi:MAG: GtrA family protein [Patescibacteria group bacterium]
MIKDIGAIARALTALDVQALIANRLVKMVIIGGIGFLIQSFIFELIGIQFDLFSPPVAALLGAEVAIVANFLLNNRFTFPNERIPFSWAMLSKFFKFNAAVVLSLGIQWLTVTIGEWAGGGNDWILRLSNVVGVLIGFIMNYMTYTKIIWRMPSPTHPPDEYRSG